jgi:hypothetical protein
LGSALVFRHNRMIIARAPVRPWRTPLQAATF